MHHTSWTAKDGAPKIVLAMTQTPDGWLWLAGTTGLFRFDGVTFSRYVPASGSFPTVGITAITSLPNGDIWLGYRFGGVGWLKDGVLRNYGEREGLPLNRVSAIAVAPDGRVFAATTKGVFLKQGERWQTFTLGLNADHHVPGISAMLVDSRGSLWAATDTTVRRLDPGDAGFTLLPIENKMGGTLSEAPDGSIWAMGGRNYVAQMLQGPLAGRRPDAAALERRSAYLLVDHDGARWTRAPDSVERQFQRDGKVVVERLGLLQGMSGSNVTSVLEDREGDVWVSTDGGVDRFRRNKLTSANLPPVRVGEARPIVADGHGGLWTGGYYIPRHDQNPVVASSMPATALAEVSSLYREPDGTIWAGGWGSLAYLRDGAPGALGRAPASAQPAPQPAGAAAASPGVFVPIQLPDIAAGRPVMAVARGGDGALWISLYNVGVLALRDGAWRVVEQFPEAPDTHPLSITADPLGRLWFAYPGNRIALRQDGKLTLLRAADGVDVGAVFQVYADGKDVWIGGETGVAHFDGKRFVAVKGRGDEAFLGTSGIVRAADGALWLNGSAGISRIGHAELLRAAADAAYRVPFTRLDYQDGLPGVAPQMAPMPSASAGPDGRLWFTTSSNVVSLDPTQAIHNRVVPSVQILALKAAGLRRAPRPGMVFAPGTAALEIDYTALSLAMPERMQFKYRLDGVDADWQDAGTRRSAFYTSLKPGSYRFSVIAANNDGVWNQRGATLAFSIAPTVLQAWWFRAIALLLALAALWALHRYRLRVMAGRIHARLAERIDERERIARELHDSFLQTLQGMVYHIHTATQKIPRQEPGRALVETALQLAENVFNEGRERIRLLRHQAARPPLEDQLAALALPWRQAGGPRFDLAVSGLPRQLHPIVQEEVHAIAREAMSNAYQHAGAQCVTVAVAYDAGELRVSVSDDGTGIAADVLLTGGVDGHWGLAGMRERADQIQARLVIRNLERGSAVELTLSAALAYQQERAAGFWARLLRRGQPR